MKKTTENHKQEKDAFKLFAHELWDSADDENQPKIKELERSDEVTVEQVLIIGGYLALNRLHDELHKDDIKQLLGGKIEVRQIAPDNMPPELVEILEQVVGKLRKNLKKGEK